MHTGIRHLFSLWVKWKTSSTNKKIFSAALTVAVLTIAVKSSAIAKDLLVANQFGTADALDAFIIALLLPSFIINVVSGSIKAALIPVYVNVVETQTPENSKKVLSSIIYLTLCLLITLSILLVFSAPYFLQYFASGFGPDKLALTQSLLYILIPTLIVGSLSSIWGAIINASEYFASVAITPIIIQIFIIIALLFFGNRWGIYALATGTTIGFVFEFFWIVLILKRLDIVALPHWYGMDLSTQQVIKQFLPMAAGVMLMSSTELVDQVMAAMFDSGSVATLNYGNKLTSLLTGIGSIALGTAIFPYFSKQVSMKNWSAIRHTFNIYMRFILLTTIPLTIAIIYLSYPLIELIFERGAFEPEDTQLVSHVQAFYLLQVPLYILGIMCARLLNSLSKNYLLMKISFINLIVNISGNLILTKYFGLAGIALSTSIVYLVSVLFMIFYINKYAYHKNSIT